DPEGCAFSTSQARRRARFRRLLSPLRCFDVALSGSADGASAVVVARWNTMAQVSEQNLRRVAASAFPHSWQVLMIGGSDPCQARAPVLVSLKNAHTGIKSSASERDRPLSDRDRIKIVQDCIAG